MKKLTRFLDYCAQRIAPYRTPILQAALVCAVGFFATQPAHAAGLDWSDLKDLGTSFRDLVLYACALGGMVAMVFGAFKFAGRDYTEGVMGVGGGLAVLWASGHALGWDAAITGIAL
jgi:hypothetical protein